MIGIADDLSGAVVGDVTTPSCLVDLDAQACELRIACGDVRPAAALTPSVMTGGCCRRSRRSGTRPARRSSTSAFCMSSASAVRNDSEAPDFQRARLRRRASAGKRSAVVGVKALQPLLHVGHELIGNGSVHQSVVVAECRDTPSSGFPRHRRRQPDASRSCRRREWRPAAG